MKRSVRLAAHAVALTAFLLLSGCATVALTPETTARCGPRPTDEQVQRALAAWSNLVLKDPFSAVTRNAVVGEPAVWRVSGVLNGNRTAYGWTISFEVNAKNGFGGYTGWQAHELLFTPDELVYANRLGF